MMSSHSQRRCPYPIEFGGAASPPLWRQSSKPAYDRQRQTSQEVNRIFQHSPTLSRSSTIRSSEGAQVQAYLEFFVQITKHGAYIDGFAGPQYFDKPDTWAAALVLESKPKWLRHFFLCELTKCGVTALKKLVKVRSDVTTSVYFLARGQ